MEGLTKRNKEVLFFIKKFVKKNLFQPTLIEIGKEFGVTGPAMTYQIKALEKKGFVKRLAKCQIKFLKPIK